MKPAVFGEIFYSEMVYTFCSCSQKSIDIQERNKLQDS